MSDLDDKIAMARQHVIDGRRIVRQQRARIANKIGGPEAQSLLETFERSLEIFEQDLERLLTERDG